MTTAPFVELRFNPTDLRPRDLPHAGVFLGSPADALEASLSVIRAAMIDQMRDEIRGLANPTHAQLLRIADLAWQGMFWRYRKVSAPVIADAYIRAYRAADAGDVPMSVIYDLADKHAEKIGGYFHESSREGLADGFNTLVNRRIPARAAADRVLDAYGLTPRQMRAYTSAKQFETPISDVMPRSIRGKARAFIDKSFTSRIRKLSQQEEHNIDQQAQQFAWMWLQDKGRLSEKALKLWITAKDERVCEVCGPLHNKRVPVGEQFKTAHGDFWTPGLHPNCRCVVRLLEHRFSKADWEPKLHPRGGDPENPGRFSRKPGTLVRLAEPEAPPETEVETVTEVERSIDIQPSFDIRPSTRRSIDLRPIDIAPAVQPSIDIKPALLPTVDIAPALPFLKPSIDIKPSVKPKLDLAPKTETKVTVDLAPQAKTQTLHQDGRSFYGILGGLAPEAEEMDFYLDRERFTDSLWAAKRRAADARKAKVQAEYDRILGKSGTETIRVYTTNYDGERLHAYINRHDLHLALTTVSDQAQGKYDLNNLPASHEHIPVMWRNNQFEAVTEGVISFTDIVTQNRVRPEDFVVRILEVQEGHLDESQTRLVQENTFNLSGQYVVESTGGSVPDADGKETAVSYIRPYV